MSREVVLALVHLFRLGAVRRRLRADRPAAAQLLVLGGLAYGLVLYLVSFRVIARLLFPWFVDERGLSQVLEIIMARGSRND